MSTEQPSPVDTDPADGGPVATVDPAAEVVDDGRPVLDPQPIPYGDDDEFPRATPGCRT